MLRLVLMPIVSGFVATAGITAVLWAINRSGWTNPDMVRAADLVLVMEAGHKRSIDVADPAARGKVQRLGEWQDKDIDDPYRQPIEAFADALEDIKTGVASWAEKIKA